MTENVDNLVLEHLKKIQAEQLATRERDREMAARFSHMESMMARVVRDNAHLYEEQIMDRHASDAIRERLARIERRLEIGDA